MKVRVRLALLLSAVALIAWFTPSIHTGIANLLSYNACTVPLSYTLGALDPKFNLTQADALKSIQVATDIWDKSYGKPLFTNSSDALVHINFIYDERTALRTNISAQQRQLDKKNTSLEQQISAYQADANAFQKKINDFNEKVHKLNESGGVSQEEYDKIVAEQKGLNAEGDALNARASELSLGTRTYNAGVEKLNDNVSQFNEEIIGKPEEGLYNADDHTITIYFAENHTELVHTLAHELGHALGMIHTDGKKDIMYPSASPALVPTSNDTAQLAYVCRVQSLPMHVLEVYSTWLHKMLRLYES